MTDSSVVPMDYEEHNKTFARFVRCTTGMTLACLFILVALVGFGIGEGATIYLVSTFGMLIGFGTSIYGSASAQNSWIPGVVVLVGMGIAVAGLL